MSDGQSVGPADRQRFVLTAHAAQMLMERGVSLTWVEQVLTQPDWIEPDKADPAARHALGRILDNGGRVLRVVYNQETEPPRVITAYFDRRERNRA